METLIIVFSIATVVFVTSLRLTLLQTIKTGTMSNYRLSVIIIWFLSEFTIGSSLVVLNGIYHTAGWTMMASSFLLIPIARLIVKKDGRKINMDKAEKHLFVIGLVLFSFLVLSLILKWALQYDTQYQKIVTWITLILQISVDFSAGTVIIRNLWKNPWGESLSYHFQILILNICFLTSTMMQSTELESIILPLFFTIAYSHLYFVVRYRRKKIKNKNQSPSNEEAIL